MISYIAYTAINYFPAMITFRKSMLSGTRRVFNAPVAKIWQHFTEPSLMKKWWGPKNYTTPFIKTDLHIGGEYLCCKRSAGGQHFWSKGVYKEIVPYKKLVVTDVFADAGGNTVPAAYYGMEGNRPLELLLTILFEAADGKTLLTFQCESLAGGSKDSCMQGWNESLDKLHASLETVIISTHDF